MSLSTQYDLFVIGGGSGGVRCARVAAGHGARVGIAESRFWGGTCVNVGCVPKKLMVQAAEYAGFAHDARGFGWADSAIGTHGWPSFIATKDAEIARLNRIYRQLLEQSGVDIFDAHARFLDPHTLDVGGQRIHAKRILIATGGQPLRPDIPGAEFAIVSDEAFHLPAAPRRVVLVGGGYIAVEFATIFAGLGAQVDLVYRQPLPLRGFDEDLRSELAEALANGGVRLHPATSPVGITLEGTQRRVSLDDGTTLVADLVFLATGRVPNTASLHLDSADVACGRHGAVRVDQSYATSQPHIYAIGDVTDRLNLTPVAIAEGHNLADRLFASHPPRSWSFAAVPTAVFTIPPIATVGLTEMQAAELGPHEIYLARFTPMRHTLSGRARKTVMKLVVERDSQVVVGAHMLGEDAPELIQGLAIAITAGATKADFDRTVGIHPTAAEEFVTMRSCTRIVGEK